MSSQQPGASRRRRIAGERRRPAETTETTATTAATAIPASPPVGPPVSLTGPPGEPADRRDAEPQEPSGWLRSRRSVVVLSGALAVLVTLGVLAALGLLGNEGIPDSRRADSIASAETAALAASERAAAAILAYDYRSLDADKDAASRFMTPAFAEKYTETFEKVVKPTATESKAQLTAKVQSAGVVRAGVDRVRVLLFVDQTTLSTANPGPQLALNRVEFVMVKRGDSWLVDDITSY